MKGLEGASLRRLTIDVSLSLGSSENDEFDDDDEMLKLEEASELLEHDGVSNGVGPAGEKLKEEEEDKSEAKEEEEK